ncbi:MAG TPA: PT domain-containing protein [Nitriliruptorales bacterium]|nr:PT domain-containing protein [Nitriliruptorales bacterium]
MLAVQVLGILLVAAGLFLMVRNLLGPGQIVLPGVSLNVPSSLLVLVVGVAVFLFPFSPWWPADEPTDGPTNGPTNGPTDGPTNGPTDGPTEASTEVTEERLTLDARNPWVATGVQVEPLDHVTIEAQGQVFHNGSEPTGPDGDGRPELRQFNIVPEAGHAALIGRFGDGEPFVIGSEIELSGGEGELLLQVNDVGLDNNSGAFEVTITVQRA